jgi:ABC-type multidrug transport system ATPase subunit
MSKYLLEIDQLDRVFKSDLLKTNVHAVRNISCAFPEGEATAIIGHNGAGKTTTIRMILGLVKADSGHIFFRGNPIKISDRAQIGYMPEVHRLTGALTPEETLKIHLKYYPQIQRNLQQDAIDRSL